MLFLLGNAIRKSRRQQKLTQSELANATGIGRSTLSQIENGSVTDIGIRKIIRVLDYLGLELTTRQQGAPPTLEELRRELVNWLCPSYIESRILKVSTHCLFASSFFFGKTISVCRKRRSVPWAPSPVISFFLPPG
jgi:transcriptional regulator with XRE-family HTH domain